MSSSTVGKAHFEMELKIYAFPMYRSSIVLSLALNTVEGRSITVRGVYLGRYYFMRNVYLPTRVRDAREGAFVYPISQLP